MLKYIKISKRPRILYRLTGLTREQFTALCTKLKPLWEKAADSSLRQSIRHRISPDVKKVSTLEKLLVVCPDFAEVVTDATEQQRRRPKKRIQKQYYSGEDLGT